MKLVVRNLKAMKKFSKAEVNHRQETSYLKTEFSLNKDLTSEARMSREKMPGWPKKSNPDFNLNTNQSLNIVLDPKVV